MTGHGKYWLTSLLLILSLILFAEARLGIINDRDGFTNVRKGPGKQFDVVDTLYNGDFYYYEILTNAEWVKLTAWKGRSIQGFIHISRVQEVEKLDVEKQRQIITQVLNRHRTLADSMDIAWNSKDNINLDRLAKKRERSSDSQYDPVLEFLPNYICKTGDTGVLGLLIATMWADKGSVNEAPSYAIGACFICKPQLVLEQLGTLKNKDQKLEFYNHIDFGLVNLFSVSNDGKSTNSKYYKLKAKLDAERRKASP